jgi:hypothetical protein
VPQAVRRGKTAGCVWPEPGIAVHGWNHAGDARVAGAGEGVAGRSREGLAAGPRVAASEREEKWAADT